MDGASLILLAFVILMAAVFLFSLARSWGQLRRNRARRTELHAERYRLARICPHCGYDVRAALKPDASGKCPECGKDVLAG